jgi:hypothetical protein
MESTRGIAASTEPLERAAHAPIAATCLSAVLRETPSKEGPELGLDARRGTSLSSLKLAIGESLHFWAKEKL